MSNLVQLQKVLVVNGWSAGKNLWSEAIANLRGLAAELEILDLDSLDVCENFDAILQQKVKSNTLIIGWSLGAQMAIDSLIKSDTLSKQVSGLIALQSTPCFMQKEEWHYGYPVEGFESLNQLCVDKDFVSVKRVFAHLLTLGSDSCRDDRKFLKSEYVNKALPDQEVLLKGLKLLRDMDLRQGIQMLPVNMLWLLGENDALVSPKAKVWLEKIEHFQVEVLGGMGHFPCGLYWQRVFDSIQRFIEVK